MIANNNANNLFHNTFKVIKVTQSKQRPNKVTANR